MVAGAAPQVTARRPLPKVLMVATATATAIPLPIPHHLALYVDALIPFPFVFERYLPCSLSATNPSG